MLQFGTIYTRKHSYLQYYLFQISKKFNEFNPCSSVHENFVSQYLQERGKLVAIKRKPSEISGFQILMITQDMYDELNDPAPVQEGHVKVCL